MILLLLFLAACFLAYTNGANDNFKGVATLFGSGIVRFKGAIIWATITTLAGSIAALFLASSLVKNFSGKGLVPDALIQTPEFAIAIALGAAFTVFMATKLGMPISTTHALVGALFGCGVVAVGADFNFAKLGNTFLMPLILSPLMAAGMALLAYLIFKKVRKVLHIKKGSFFLQEENRTIETYEGKILGIDAQKGLNFFHYLSSGIVGFARGLNDTPKIVGLLVVIQALDIRWGMLAIAIAMALGGWLNSKKVGEVMSKKITPMNSGQGFTANLTTGLLVTTASLHGLPVSTTHVSVGSIFGIGTVTKKADFKVIKKILLSWLLTLPIAAVCSGLLYLIFLQF